VHAGQGPEVALPHDVVVVDDQDSGFRVHLATPCFVSLPALDKATFVPATQAVRKPIRMSGLPSRAGKRGVFQTQSGLADVHFFHAPTPARMNKVVCLQGHPARPV
jgi:hypothetical protein